MGWHGRRFVRATVALFEVSLRHLTLNGFMKRLAGRFPVACRLSLVTLQTPIALYGGTILLLSHSLAMRKPFDVLSSMKNIYKTTHVIMRAAKMF